MKTLPIKFQSKPLLWALCISLSALPGAARAQDAAPVLAGKTEVSHAEDEDSKATLLDALLLEYSETVKKYDEAVAKNPQSAAAFFNRGTYHLDHGEFQSALSDTEKAIALDPQDPNAYLQLGQSLRGLNRTEESASAFKKVHEIDPESPVPFYAIGLTYLQGKQYNRALESFTQKLALDPDNRPSLVKRGQTYFELRKYSSALDDLNKVIELEKKDEPHDLRATFNRLNPAFKAQAYFYRSLILARKLDMTDKDDALAPVSADATEAVKDDEKLVDEYLQRTTPMLLDSNQKYAAHALLLGVAAAKPQDIRVFLQLADAQHKCFRSEAAIKTYTEILAMKPQPPITLAALRGRAATYADHSVPYDAEQWKPAVDDLVSAAFLDSKDAPTLLSLTVARYNAGQNDAGLLVIRHLLKDQPENAYAHILLGLGLALNADKDGAANEVKTWLPKLSEAETEEAKETVGNASGHYPDNAALKTIYELIPDQDEDEDATPYFL